MSLALITAHGLAVKVRCRVLRVGNSERDHTSLRQDCGITDTASDQGLLRPLSNLH